jgi:ribosomal protein S12 methylthiotransferase accessory factor YcaO
MGSGLTLEAAAEKALLESLQIRAGLAKLCASDIGKATIPSSAREAIWTWSDPASVELLRNVVKETRPLPIRAEKPDLSIVTALDTLRSTGHDITYARLGALEHLEVVRVHVGNTIAPEPVCEDLPPRLVAWLRKTGLPAPYPDPILS